MKSIKATADMCDCGCPHCDYSIYNARFCAECPYCDGAEDWGLEVDEGEKQKIQCSYCNKSFRCKVLFNNI